MSELTHERTPGHRSNATPDAPAPIAPDQVFRLAWMRQWLAGLKRWSVFVAIGVLAIGGWANSGIAGLLGAVGLLVMPLAQELVQWDGQPLASLRLLAGVLVYAGVALAVAMAQTPLLHPKRWRKALNQLPLAGAQLRALNRELAGLALAPVAVLWLASLGAAACLGLPPLLLACTLGALALAGANAFVACVWVLGRGALPFARPTFTATFQPKARGRRTPNSTHAAKPLSWVQAGLVLMLAKRAAPRASYLFAALCVTAALPAVGLWRWPTQAWAVLMAAAVLWQCSSSALAASFARHFAPRHQRMLALPVSAAQWHWARWLGSNWPVWLGMALVATVALMPVVAPITPLTLSQGSGQPSWRWTLLLCFLLVALMSNLWLTRSPSQEPTKALNPKADARAASWVLCLVVQLALASESMG